MTPPTEADAVELARNLLGTKRISAKEMPQTVDGRASEVKCLILTAPGGGRLFIACASTWEGVCSEVRGVIQLWEAVLACREADKKEAGA